MRQALIDLGLDDGHCRLGIRVHKVNVVWPLEAGGITRDFAEGLQEILVVEEKRQVINTRSRSSSTTGAPTCARTCWASSTGSRPFIRTSRSWGMPEPQPELAAAPRPT